MISPTRQALGTIDQDSPAEEEGAEPDPAEPYLIDLLYDEDDTVDIFSTPEDRDTSNSHHSSDFLTQDSQSKKDAAVSDHDNNENQVKPSKLKIVVDNPDNSPFKMEVVTEIEAGPYKSMKLKVEVT